jgi:hypothetical protein
VPFAAGGQFTTDGTHRTRRQVRRSFASDLARALRAAILAIVGNNGYAPDKRPAVDDRCSASPAPTSTCRTTPTSGSISHRGPQSTGHGFDGYLRIKAGRPSRLARSENGSRHGRHRERYGSIGNNRRYVTRPIGRAMVGRPPFERRSSARAAAMLLLLAS